MKSNKQFILKKIPLEEFIDLLQTVYDDGADFIDIVGKPNDEQDSIGIVVRDDYFSTDVFEDPNSEDEYLSLT